MHLLRLQRSPRPSGLDRLQCDRGEGRQLPPVAVTVHFDECVVCGRGWWLPVAAAFRGRRPADVLNHGRHAQVKKVLGVASGSHGQEHVMETFAFLLLARHWKAAGRIAPHGRRRRHKPHAGHSAGFEEQRPCRIDGGEAIAAAKLVVQRRRGFWHAIDRRRQRTNNQVLTCSILPRLFSQTAREGRAVASGNESVRDGVLLRPAFSLFPRDRRRPQGRPLVDGLLSARPAFLPIGSLCHAVQPERLHAHGRPLGTPVALGRRADGAVDRHAFGKHHTSRYGTAEQQCCKPLISGVRVGSLKHVRAPLPPLIAHAYLETKAVGSAARDSLAGGAQHLQLTLGRRCLLVVKVGEQAFPEDEEAMLKGGILLTLLVKPAGETGLGLAHPTCGSMPRGAGARGR
mmetsp:Transcript_9993/g.25869  ORF Transcript_9993/g.25869 Transcript_9993/m.25869 type:complete len:401 (-) Transcript_9993:39-1241(-)